jgi:hypothetical protein
MDDLRTRAHLVAPDHAGSIGTVISRAEIAEAAGGPEFPATLYLDLDRVEADGGEIAAQATVAVDWDKEMLDQLLASTDDEEISLWFEERELALAFDDVEAHGLREKAAILAIAATAAGAVAGPAFSATGGGGSAVTPVTGFGTTPKHFTPTANPGQIGTGFRTTPEHFTPTANPGDIGTGFRTNPEHVTPGGQTTVPSVSGGNTFSSGDVAGVVAGGVLLIAAAGFGATRKRMPPVQPA